MQVETLDNYQDKAMLTAIYPEKGTGSLVAVTYCALGLGESGEAQGKLKKVWRKDKTLDEAKIDLISELGDVLWYVACMAKELGADLSLVASLNLSKLAERKERGTLQGSGDNR